MNLEDTIPYILLATGDIGIIIIYSLYGLTVMTIGAIFWGILLTTGAVMITVYKFITLRIKIKKTRFWMETRILFGLLSLLCIIMGFVQPGIALLIITLQRTFHEFIHGITVLLLGENITEFSLSYSESYIDFTHSSVLQKQIIYFAGFAFDLVCTLISAYLLITTGGIFAGFGYAILLISLYYHVSPEESDFNQWRNAKRNY